jgi:hypothetical protein
MTSTIGIMQALISVFIDDGDKIRCINAGSTRITFVLRAPLYYVCASSWGEPESVVRISDYTDNTSLILMKEDTLPSRIPTFANFEYRHCRTTATSIRTTNKFRLAPTVKWF